MVGSYECCDTLLTIEPVRDYTIALREPWPTDNNRGDQREVLRSSERRCIRQDFFDYAKILEDAENFVVNGDCSGYIPNAAALVENQCANARLAKPASGNGARRPKANHGNFVLRNIFHSGNNYYEGLRNRIAS